MQQAGHFFETLGSKFEADAVLDTALFSDLHLIRAQHELERYAGHAACSRITPAGHEPYRVDGSS